VWEESDEIEEDEDDEIVDELDMSASEDSEEEVGSLSVAWEDDDFGDYPLEDDPDDPNYQTQKMMVEQAAADAVRRREDENFDPLEFIQNEMTSEMQKEMEELPFIKEVNERTKNMRLTEEDVADLDLEKEVAEVSDLYDDDPYPRHEEGETNLLEKRNGITDDDMEEMDNMWKEIRQKRTETPWDKVFVREQEGLEGLSNETLEEVGAALHQIRGSPYNCTRWLLYDLDFNVTNLMLAAVKHNREAPILFQHWYPQLLTYSRYKSAQDRNFDFTWEEVESADTSELERYYLGIGYEEIPEKAPAETGIIEFDFLDEEEMKMAAFQDWFTEVYNPEYDRKDFDDDDWKDEDNVFSAHYEPPDHPDMPKEAEINPRQLKRGVGYTQHSYEVIWDKEFEDKFRGHLVVACTPNDSDLEIAEKITLVMAEQFGKQIYVETRVIAHAREEDNVFEVWLESYEIELLHSKRRATSNTKDWDGPAECDDKQIDYLVDSVGYLISDDSRYSYHMEMEVEL
jgi:hypothetical protein